MKDAALVANVGTGRKSIVVPKLESVEAIKRKFVQLNLPETWLVLILDG